MTKTSKLAKLFLKAGISFYNNVRLFEYFLACRIDHVVALILVLFASDVPIGLLCGLDGLVIWSVGCMVMLIFLVEPSKQLFDAGERRIISALASFSLACIGGFLAWFICFVANIDGQNGRIGLFGGAVFADIVVFFVSAILAACNMRSVLERASSFLGFKLGMRGRLLFLTNDQSQI